MAINDNTKGMIDALAKGDIPKAKAYAQCILANDKAEKNKYWRESRSAMLTSGQKKARLELPAALLSFCELVEPNSDFCADRYYLPEAEAPVVEEIIRKQKVVSRMQMLGVTAGNTALLYGPPGTGKTELAKYVAYRLQKPILILRFSNLIDSYMGGTGKHIGQVFDFFKQNEIILFLDEIDTVASKRDGGKGCDGEISRTTACIMQELDRLSGGGIIIAATNRRDLLDDALLRRFSIHHEVKCVEEKERKKMVEKFWSSIGITIPFSSEEYAKAENTPSKIHTDMVSILSEYLEQHTEDTEREAELKESILLPEQWAEVFLQTVEMLNTPDKLCVEVEKETYRLATIADKVSAPEEARIQYCNTPINYDTRIDAMRYSMLLCRTAWKEFYHTEKEVTLEELKKWVIEERKYKK